MLNPSQAAPRSTATAESAWQVTAGATPEPTAGNAMPANGGIPGCLAATSETRAFVAYQAGYCFLYPTGFQPIQPEGMTANFAATVIVGPDHSGKRGTEPLRATLMIDATQLANGQSAAQVAAGLVAQYPNASVTRSDLALALDGIPAVVLEGLPRQGTSREVIAVHSGRVYHLILTPVGVEDAAVREDFERLWRTVLDSFVIFVPR
ncbi:MAG: hypothetical protein M1434_07680 [Chloroflexi bacterium]|nr:hypothetical protein [Chloroflexota bacterium]